MYVLLEFARYIKVFTSIYKCLHVFIKLLQYWENCVMKLMFKQMLGQPVDFFVIMEVLHSYFYVRIFGQR